MYFSYLKKKQLICEILDITKKNDCKETCLEVCEDEDSRIHATAARYRENVEEFKTKVFAKLLLDGKNT